MSKLSKPQFVKVNTLVDARNGFNVYVKVTQTEQAKSNDGLTTFIRAVVADQTGSAKAFFKGQTAKLIKKGAVIAIRNGRIRLIKNFISLEIDIFGRVTPENVQIKENAANNISEKEIERKRRPREYNDKPRREGDDRPRREGGYDRPRREGNDRPRREGGYDKPREDRPREDRPREDRPRRENNDRPRREDDRPPREYERKREDKPERKYREENYQEKPRETRGGYREQRGREERKPRDNEERGERRPPVNWSKIAGLDPGDEDLNIIAKVLSVKQVGKKARVTLGDETGMVKAFMYMSDALKEGNSVVIFKCEASVVKEHIELQLMERGKVDIARREIRDVNRNFDVSAKEWVEQA